MKGTRGVAALLLAAAGGLAVASANDELASRSLLFPLPEAQRHGLRDAFSEKRGARAHEAVDIMAPRGTPVYAVEAGRIAKLFKSVPGGNTIYQFDPTGRFAYYYAHLDRYAPGLAEGQEVKRGDTIGFVGSTGNAAENAPHLHFAIFKLGPDRRWWQGEAIDPYPYLARRPGEGRGPISTSPRSAPARPTPPSR